MKKVIKILGILMCLPICYCKSAFFVWAEKIGHFSKIHFEYGFFIALTSLVVEGICGVFRNQIVIDGLSFLLFFILCFTTLFFVFVHLQKA